MIFKKPCKLLILLLICLIFCFTECFLITNSSAYATPLQDPSKLLDKSSETGFNWCELDGHLTDAVKNAYKNIENFAQEELDIWNNDLIKKVDEQFLDWYFSYLNQKSMEFGVPFAWLVFQLDSSFKILRQEDEKNLNVDQLLQKRMIEDFNNKFKELVLNPEAEEALKKIIGSIVRNYSASIALLFSQVKALYRVPDADWDKHTENLARIVFDTGRSKSSLSSDSFNSDLFTTVMALTTVKIGSKLASKFAIKTGSKIAIEGGTALVLKIGTQMLDPLLAIGFLAWDVWDYQSTVAKSRPELRNNLVTYLNELKSSILEDDTDNSIMDAITQIQTQLINALTSQCLQSL